ncbi:hypothetical protein ATO12_17215 [Aquimarina atlantica]|uniref:Signal peptidase I n=1 Tax=Aquimarina atlantica TaxID=1317122 RepID=A0A023BUJ6_9FLAO|nr:signal peptidase I [Aquimarina atlantica]EZH73676.1 hypothetical protein ATO12_17215 [Aquimarina atlantica]
MYIKKRYLNYLIKGIILFFCLILFKVFIADLYYIPTSSMEYTIEKKSFAIASKIHYGAILPETTHDIPYLSKAFKKIGPIRLWKNIRMIGYRDVKREDIILAKYNDIKIVKRVIGIYGDTIKIINGHTIINSKNERILDTYRYKFRGNLEKSIVKKIEGAPRIKYLGENLFELTLTGKEYGKIGNKKIIAQSKINNLVSFKKDSIFPRSMFSKWDENNYGPIIVPFKGMRIDLNEENYNMYRQVIGSYENVNLKKHNSKFFLRNKEVTSFTFTNDYFFLLGDNRMESIDSRFIGFIPKKCIVGKILFWF